MTRDVAPELKAASKLRRYAAAGLALAKAVLMGFRVRWALALVWMGAMLPAPSAAAYWDSDYLQAEEAGQLSCCVAGIEYTNAYFLARLHGKKISFVFYRDDFTLPFDTFLGRAVFQIDGEVFVLGASSAAAPGIASAHSAQTMYFHPSEGDRAGLFAALKEGFQFDILFPDGSGYAVELTGSARALSAASECWRRNPTGPLRNNPFADSDGVGPPASKPGTNPFRGTAAAGADTPL